ncbi:MAG: hypothetical protein FWG75_00410 [Cystobacterineae bacterium]|nr:hypothetical protein [Cystobacterineae bacterium]
MSVCLTLTVFLLSFEPGAWNAQEHAKIEEAMAKADKEAEDRWLKNKKPSELSYDQQQAMFKEKNAAKERILSKHGKTLFDFEREKLSLDDDKKHELKQATDNLRNQREQEAVEAAVREALREDSLQLVSSEKPPPPPPASAEPPPRRRGRR